MKRILWISLVLLVVLSATAFAGLGDIAKGAASWLLESGILWVVGLLLSIGVVAFYADWISLLFVSVGEFLTIVGVSFTDKKLTKEELQSIKDAFTKMKVAFKNRPKK